MLINLLCPFLFAFCDGARCRPWLSDGEQTRRLCHPLSGGGGGNCVGGYLNPSYEKYEKYEKYQSACSPCVLSLKPHPTVRVVVRSTAEKKRGASSSREICPREEGGERKEGRSVV
eukprot:1697671-Rhodomonas_salina.2